MKYFLALLLFIFGLSMLTSLQAFAAAAKGRIRSEGATIYKAASFDSPVIANLAPGTTYYISSVLFNGAFYRIMIKKNVLGYVPDYQIDPLNGSAAKAAPISTAAQKNKKMSKTADKAAERKDPAQRSIALTRYGGLEYAMIDYKEHTMGSNYHQNMSFFGFKFSGPNLMVSGPFTMDINVLMHFGAPNYYETATGNSADGFILLADMMLQTNWPLSKNAMLYYGFGPVFHFSKFNLRLGSTTPTKKSYLAEDMNLGAVFNLGLAGRLSNRWGIRGEARYYWEKTMYLGFAGAVQYSF